ncbi:MAG: peptide chain release factor N(5)-glutamine methyltransferase [Clostridia bacterium]|nr:peptide chain release factor N(5)-glutamine methyltransferase [Clostridia bacterium]
MKLQEIISALNSYGADNSKEEAFLIIEELYKIPRAKILADKEKSYTSPRISEILEKRKERIPLQYILGKWEFMGKEFLVSPDCLIPRPDTEILVEKALEIIEKGDSVADFCTGSGCIGVSLGIYKPNIDLTLVDISRGALEISKKNAQRHNISARFILGDITKDLVGEKFDVIVSNPPYIPSKDIEGLSPEVKKEPRLALDGGENGLDIINFLVNDGMELLKDNGKMLIEFGYDQEKSIRECLENNQKIASYEIFYDYGSNPRCVLIYK